jgi:hypothetical protein
MDGMGTAPGTDLSWLTKVLGDDRLACEVLNLARTLPEAEWDAFARGVERIAAGALATNAEAAPRQECGRVPP